MTNNTASWDPKSLEPDTYEASLREVEDREGGFDGTGYFRWQFSVKHDGGEVVVGQNTSKKFSPKSRAYGLTEGILGRPPAKGEVIDFDAMKGTPCRLLIGLDDEGYNVVERVLPAKG